MSRFPNLSNSTRSGWKDRHSVNEYAVKRYGSFLQGLVNRREQGLARDFLKSCQSRRSARLVDIPCGYGRFYPLYKSLGYEVISLDRSPGMVDWLKHHQALDPADRERADCADITKPLPVDGRVDVAVSIRMFQHIPSRTSRREALASLARASGGRVLLTYYDRRCLHYFTKLLIARFKGRRMRINMLSKGTMDADLASAGLRVARRRRLIPGIHAQTWLLLEPIKRPIRKMQMLLGGWLGGTTFHSAEQLLVVL